MASSKSDRDDQPQRSKRWYQLSKAEVTARIEERQRQAAERQKATPKVTSEAIAQRVAEQDAARAQRRTAKEQRDPAQRHTRINIVLGSVFVLGAVGLGGLIMTGQQAEQDRVADHRAEVTALQTQIDELSPVALDGTVSLDEHDTAEVVAVLQTDREAGYQTAAAIADAQHEFAQLYADDRNADAAEHRAMMGRWFADEVLWADRQMDDDGLVSSPTRVVPFGQDQLDPRWPWYFQSDGDPDEYGWEVESVTSVGDAGRELQMFWVNRDVETDELLAWATGTYDAEQEVVIAVEVGMTAEGARYGSMTGAAANPEDEPGDDDEPMDFGEMIPDPDGDTDETAEEDGGGQ